MSKVLPPTLPPEGVGIDEIRDTLRNVILWLQAREPDADGHALDKFLTVQAAVNAGQLTFVAGSGYAGGGGGGLVPGNGTSNPADASQPTPISGLTVAVGVSAYLVSIDAPTYAQGGGNGRTVIYKANYSGSGALPTFAAAVEAGVIPGKSTLLLLVGDPGQNARFWAKAETRHPTLQADPTGGLNGVSATASLIQNQHIANLSVSKLIAGSIAVGEHIQSTGYTGSGVNEWRIDGNGVARFTGVLVSGTLQSGTAAVSGTTMTGTGAVFNPAGSGSGAWGNSTTNLSFNGTTMTMNGSWVNTANIVVGAVTTAAASSTTFSSVAKTSALTITSTDTVIIGGFTSTGAAVTVSGAITVDVGNSLNGNESILAAVTHCLISVSLHIDGVFKRAPQGFYSTHPVSGSSPANGRRVKATIPINWREVLAAGAHTFTTVTDVSFFDSTGTNITSPALLAVSGIAISQESKV